MGIVTSLAERAHATPVIHPLCEALLDRQAISFDDAMNAMALSRRQNLRLESILTTEFGLSEQVICETLSQSMSVRAIDPVITPPDPNLVKTYSIENVLKNRILPWRRSGGTTIILCASYDQYIQHRDTLDAYFGKTRMALTTYTKIARAVQHLQDPLLVHAAETQVPAPASSRGWNDRRARQVAIFALMLACAAFTFAPLAMAAALCLCVSALIICTSALKCAALAAQPPAPQSNAALPARLPTITILVPLYKETDIAAHLIHRLEALDYPRSLLDVCLVLEADDDTTRDAVGRANLPTWMRAIVVPDGTLKTKPRALNYAMTFAQGSLIGVYDAEDAPAPDQLKVVAHHFANCRHDVACLQGTLDYYNPSANWLTRCFTLEYASWFRVILPGFAQLGLVVPLGGTTLFFRREILEKLGGWDAHNVTEDADLGIRLARHGYRTEFTPSVTEEEANGRMWPWVKQRSRWLKGYAITYAVHMRNPLKLWRDLGPWRFFGVQVLFLGTLLQFALTPVAWSFWLVPLGFAHPVQTIAPIWLVWVLAVGFLATGAINLGINIIGARRAGKTWLAPWALTLQFYFPLGMIAVYKGLLELTSKPFYWDKTAHGVLMPTTRQPPPP